MIFKLLNRFVNRSGKVKLVRKNSKQGRERKQVIDKLFIKDLRMSIFYLRV